MKYYVTSSIKTSVFTCVTLFIALSSIGQIIQVASVDRNGRMDMWQKASEVPKDTVALIRDTVIMDSLKWPNHSGRITRETVYVDPRSLIKKPPMKFGGTIGGSPTWVNLSDTFSLGSVSYKTIHRKGKTRKHYKKSHKVRVKYDYTKGKDEYYDLYFTGTGKVFSRGGDIVGIENAKGKFYHKKTTVHNAE